jgi:hypothetical protein
MLRQVLVHHNIFQKGRHVALHFWHSDTSLKFDLTEPPFGNHQYWTACVFRHIDVYYMCLLVL